MSKIAIYPGSFDPITLGHVDIIQRISLLYDQTVVLISQSPNKSAFFSAEERKDLVERCLSHLKNVKCDIHEGLTVDYMKENHSKVIVRGLRAVVDFEYELTMANMNKLLAPDIETLLVFADPKYYFISSRGVKEVAQHGGSLHGLVPDLVAEALTKKMKRS
jgi:pantetheine-phosphate adenylyltransferase